MTEYLVYDATDNYLIAVPAKAKLKCKFPKKTKLEIRAKRSKKGVEIYKTHDIYIIGQL
jgi:hypothetical protein